MAEPRLPSCVAPILGDFLPVLREWFPGAFAVALGGSRAKGLDDDQSDLDFRYYYEGVIADGKRKQELVDAYHGLLRQWETRGAVIDGFWCRETAAIDRRLERQLSGEDVSPEPLPWAVWGYELLTDVYCQLSVLDPHGIVARWKERLRPYPPAHGTAVVAACLPMLTYWRDDYHYLSKLRRGDFLFAEGLALKLINAMVRILFALNETYYVGDGNNLRFVSGFPIAPQRFAERIGRILHQGDEPLPLLDQRQLLVECIDDVERLTKERQWTS